MAKFNENLLKLDKFTEQLENGECDIETAAKLYEEGMQIIKEREQTIQNAKLKVTANDNK
ncbi:MAG: exodeoxyribonuclease VII small subunit [Oscillospiraceae bacterium]|nr:exodeoxyribonuclease VII small subunit [Candidatus Equicaccousia limihippi]